MAIDYGPLKQITFLGLILPLSSSFFEGGWVINKDYFFRADFDHFQVTFLRVAGSLPKNDPNLEPPQHANERRLQLRQAL